MQLTLKPGDFLYLGYGATMRGYKFYQVLKIDKSKVYLTEPLIEANGNQEGEIWVAGPAKDSEIIQHAKFIRGKLKLCSPEFKVENNYWNTLHQCEAGKKFYYYGD